MPAAEASGVKVYSALSASVTAVPSVSDEAALYHWYDKVPSSLDSAFTLRVSCSVLLRRRMNLPVSYVAFCPFNFGLFRFIVIRISVFDDAVKIAFCFG